MKMVTFLGKSRGSDGSQKPWPPWRFPKTRGVSGAKGAGGDADGESHGRSGRLVADGNPNG